MTEPMPAGEPTIPTRRPAVKLQPRVEALDSAILFPALLLSFASGYPTYQTARYFLVVTIGLVIGGGAAWLGLRQRWPMWFRVASAGAAYWAAGVLVASPQVFWAPASIPARMLGVLVAPMAGPRRILSLNMPLGSYHDVLAFTLFIAVAVSFVVFALVWSGADSWRLAPFVALMPMAAGTALGSDSRVTWLLSRPVAILGSQAAMGVALVLTLLLWLIWRPWSQRQDRLRKGHGGVGAFKDFPSSAQISGARGRWIALKMTRLVLAVAMVAAGLVAVALVVPIQERNHPRMTLREEVPIQVRQVAEADPLSTYREFFNDQMFGAHLFTVDAPSEATRVRLVTLGVYDGANVAVGEGESPAMASHATGAQGFERVPARVDPVGAPDGMQISPLTTRVEIAQYDGAWVPLVGELGQIRFEGERRAALQDGFFYDRRVATGIEVATDGSDGLEEGTTYTAHVWETQLPTQAIASFEPAGAGASLTTALPQSVVDWIGDQDQPRTGAGLLELIGRLRARGYLSHSLAAPDGEPWEWMRPLGDYQFEPSRAGHSLARMESLFQRLSEQALAAGPDATESELVGAVGDDEQFAVAAALIADSLGFHTRIVLGARLGGTTDSQELTACQWGKCTGGDMAVWIEVQDGGDGAWAPIDVTPQHRNRLSPRIKETSDPKHATQVRPQSAVVVPPPGAKPSGGEPEQSGKDRSSRPVTELSAAGRIALTSGLGFLAVVAIPSAILIAKVVKRRRRRLVPDAVLSICGAWDEFYDTGRAFGRPTLPAWTRAETAQHWAPGVGAPIELAHLVDRASFHRPDTRDCDVTQVWTLQKTACLNLAVGGSIWQRARARFSPSCFLGRPKSQPRLKSVPGPAAAGEIRRKRA